MGRGRGVRVQALISLGVCAAVLLGMQDDPGGSSFSARPTLKFESPLNQELTDRTQVSVALRVQGAFSAEKLRVRLGDEPIALSRDNTDPGPGSLWIANLLEVEEGPHTLSAEVENGQPVHQQQCLVEKKKAVAHDLKCRMRKAVSVLNGSKPKNDDACTRRIFRRFRSSREAFPSCTALQNPAVSIQGAQQFISERLTPLDLENSEDPDSAARCSAMRFAAAARHLQCEMKIRAGRTQGIRAKRHQKRCRKQIERKWKKSEERYGNACPADQTLRDWIVVNQEKARSIYQEKERVSAEIHFESADFSPNTDCDVLNAANCLLPWPSNHFMDEVGAESETGYRMNLPLTGALPLNGAPLSPEPWSDFDGFSPMVQILMHFEQEVDLTASKVAVLLEARCCGQSQTAPYEDVRTIDETSLSAASPTLLIDLDTGEQIPHFMEYDARANKPSERTLIMRPAIGLVAGHEYAVVIQNLIDVNGDPLVAAPAFRAIRDGQPSRVPAVEARRPTTEKLLSRLRMLGIEVEKPLLAFGFPTRSTNQSTSTLVTMRDKTLHWIDNNPLQVTLDTEFNRRDENHNPDCAETGEAIGRRAKGTFKSPFFLTPPGIFIFVGYLPVQEVLRDAEGNPSVTGLLDVPFDVAIPCEVMLGNTPPRNLLLGHGLFGDGSGIVDSVTDLGNSAKNLGIEGLEYITTATDYRGLSADDLFFVALNVVGLNNHQLNNFSSLAARKQQGMANTLALGRLLKTGRLNEIPEFQRNPGDPSSGYFPQSGQPVHYYGISYGAVMGLTFAALTPDVLQHALDVGSANFSGLVQRSTQFIQFEDLLQGIGLTNPMHALLTLGLIHEQWLPAESAGFLRHITGDLADPLPGSPPKNVLLANVWQDKQVSNQMSEITARTMGIPNVEGSLVARLVGIQDVAAPVSSGYVMHRTGSFDVFDPRYDPYLAPLANLIPPPVCDPHSDRVRSPVALRQLAYFLRENGKITNWCLDDGVCNASSNDERPNGASESCNPLP